MLANFLHHPDKEPVILYLLTVISVMTVECLQPALCIADSDAFVNSY